MGALTLVTTLAGRRMTSCHDLTSVEVVQRIAAIPMERSGLSGLIDDLALPSFPDDFPPPPPSPLGGVIGANEGSGPVIWPTSSKRHSPTRSLLNHSAHGCSGGDGPSAEGAASADGAATMAPSGFRETMHVDAALSEHLFGGEGRPTGTSAIATGSRATGSIAAAGGLSAAAVSEGCSALQEVCGQHSLRPPLCSQAERQQQGEREDSPRSVAATLGTEVAAAPALTLA